MQTKPKALLLISGGIDSPVAGRMLQDKFDLVAIHFSQEPFTDNSAEIKSLKLCKKLGLKEMLVVDAGEELKEISENSYREYYFILMKRFMLKVSELIAKEKNCSYLITGEALGQVSSQTLSNLNSINQATKIQILRPLMFLSKQEIIDKSREFGYFETSQGPEMCDALATGTPKTQSDIVKVVEQEKHCSMDEQITKAVKKIRIENTSKETQQPMKIINLCK
jgi:thiamine biosynthesis protein ThiI